GLAVLATGGWAYVRGRGKKPSDRTDEQSTERDSPAAPTSTAVKERPAPPSWADTLSAPAPPVQDPEQQGPVTETEEPRAEESGTAPAPVEPEPAETTPPPSEDTAPPTTVEPTDAADTTTAEPEAADTTTAEPEPAAADTRVPQETAAPQGSGQPPPRRDPPTTVEPTDAADTTTAEPEAADTTTAEPEPAAADTSVPEETAAPEDSGQPPAVIDRPEAPGDRMVRLRERLSRSGSIGRGILNLLTRGSIDEDTWDEIEETLLLADLGPDATDELMDNLRRRIQVLGTDDVAAVREVLREELLALVDPELDRRVAASRRTASDGTEVPSVLLMVGVNGTGKTTTVGKLARVLVAAERTVVLGAADTFRAAAADQLATWGARVGV